MNICFLSYRENNPYIGGIENVTYALSKELTKRGHNIICLSQIHSQIDKPYTPVYKELFLPNHEQINSKENLVFLCKLIKEEDIDIIINQYSTTLGFCELCQNAKQLYNNIKIVTPLHLEPEQSIKGIKNNFFIKYKNGGNIKKWIIDLILFLKFHLYKKKRLYKKINKELNYIIATSDKVVILSKNTQKDVERITGKECKDKLCSIGNPIKTNTDVKQTGKKKQVLYVGRLEFGLKRIDRVIEIWKIIEKKNPNWCLRIVGDGAHRQKFENDVKKEKIERLYFEGYQAPQEYYKESSIICLTSSSESFAIVLAEAQSYGCVPIAYNSYSALSDIIIDGYNGYTITPFNKKTFVEKLQKLINDNELRNSMSSNAIEHSKKFDINLIADKWEELFHNLTHNS